MILCPCILCSCLVLFRTQIGIRFPLCGLKIGNSIPFDPIALLNNRLISAALTKEICTFNIFRQSTLHFIRPDSILPMCPEKTRVVVFVVL